MINVVVNADKTVVVFPKIAAVYPKGTIFPEGEVEALQITYKGADIKGTLKQIMWIDDFGGSHTRLLGKDNTVSLCSFNSNSLQVQFQIISALSGVIQFASEWFTLLLTTASSEPVPEEVIPWPPAGPVVPPLPNTGCPPSFLPPRNTGTNEFLYDFCTKLSSSLSTESVNRETGDENVLATARALVEESSSSHRVVESQIEATLDEVSGAIDDLSIESGGIANRVTALASELATLQARIDSLQAQVTVGYGRLSSRVEGITSTATVVYFGDVGNSTSYTYAFERNGSQIVSWTKAANEDMSTVVVADAAVKTDGNQFCVYNSTFQKVCEADVKIYNTSDGAILQFVAPRIQI